MTISQGAPAPETYLTVTEVAARLRISRWKVYELIRARELDSFLIGRCRRIPEYAVSDLVSRLMDEVA